MFDMGFTEILLIGVIALIVVGPKDLPRMLRTLGQYTGKLRGMAREFQRSMDDAAREADMAELKDIKNTLSDVRAIQNDTTSAIRSGMSKIDKELDENLDLDPGMVDETGSEPAAEAPKPSALNPTANGNFVTQSGPVDRPDPSAGQVKPAAEPATASASETPLPEAPVSNPALSEAAPAKSTASGG